MIADIPLLPILLKLGEGLLATLMLSLMAFVLGGTAGLVVLFARVGRNATLQRVSKVYIQVFQNTRPWRGLRCRRGQPPPSA